MQQGQGNSALCRESYFPTAALACQGVEKHCRGRGGSAFRFLPHSEELSMRYRLSPGAVLHVQLSVEKPSFSG